MMLDRSSDMVWYRMLEKWYKLEKKWWIYAWRNKRKTFLYFKLYFWINRCWRFVEYLPIFSFNLIDIRFNNFVLLYLLYKIGVIINNFFFYINFNKIRLISDFSYISLDIVGNNFSIITIMRIIYYFERIFVIFHWIILFLLFIYAYYLFLCTLFRVFQFCSFVNIIYEVFLI